MKLPGKGEVEFVEILPFTPSNRNNLIGWIAGRSDGANYGTALVYDFPKTRLVDGPLQIEARIDQNAQLSGQLSLWNQQGSHVRRGTLLVIPCGKALIYAEPIYLQAERSPMPELRLVVLALQDKLAYGATFEAALRALFGGASSSVSAEPAQPERSAATPSTAGPRRSQCAHRRSGTRPLRLPAPYIGGQTRRSRPEARATQAEARCPECAPEVIPNRRGVGCDSTRSGELLPQFVRNGLICFSRRRRSICVAST